MRGVRGIVPGQQRPVRGHPLREEAEDCGCGMTAVSFFLAFFCLLLLSYTDSHLSVVSLYLSLSPS